MTLLIFGLAVFIAVHLITEARTFRAGLISRFGEGVYKGVYSLFAALGLILIIVGFLQAETSSIYTPPAWGRFVATPLVLLTFIAFGASHLKGHIKAKLRHPMLIGVIMWALAHLLSNGDSAGIVLFGSFAVYSVLTIVLANRREDTNDFAPNKMHDVRAVVIGVVVFGVVLYLHGSLFGRALF